MDGASTRVSTATPARAAEEEPSLAVLLREGFRWFMDRLNEDASSAGEPGLSAAAAVVVSYLRPEGSRPADIARAMGVTRQHVHTVVRELIDAGIIRVVSDPHSRRDRLVVPTLYGEVRRRRAVARLTSLESALVERVGADDLQHLRQTLDRLWSPRVQVPPGTSA